MTQPPASDPNSTSPSSPKQTPPSQLGTRWRLLQLLCGVAIAFSSGMGYWRLRTYVYAELVPQVEDTLTNRLDRPIEIGAVAGFSPISIRFGPTTLPPTATDPDRATIEGIRVRFNPLEILLSRQLRLTVTLIKPELLLVQEKTGQWLKTRLKDVEPGPITIKLSQINLENSQITLLPIAASPDSKPVPVVLDGIEGWVQLRDDNRVIQLAINGQPRLGGAFELSGTIDIDEYPLFDGRVKTQRFPVAAFAPLAATYIPRQMGSLTNGFLNSQIRVVAADPRDIDNLAPNLRLEGQAEIWEMALQPPEFPHAIEVPSAKFRFRGERIELGRVRINYGDIGAKASGNIHLQDGYEITANIPTVTIAELLTTSTLTLPFEARGKFNGRFRLTGPLNTPEITGTIANKRGIFIDEIRLDTFQGRVQATPKQLEIKRIEARPRMGGTVIGNGKLDFEQGASLGLSLQIREIPGDALLRKLLAGPRNRRSRRPRFRLPRLTDPATGNPLVLDEIEANVNITGPLNQLEAIAQFQAPQATFPTKGEMQIGNRVVTVSNLETEFSQGRVTVDGEVNFNENQWEANAQIEEVPLTQFPLAKLPLDKLPVRRLPNNPIISVDALEDLAQNPPVPPVPSRRIQQSRRRNNRHNHQNGVIQGSSPPRRDDDPTEETTENNPVTPPSAPGTSPADATAPTNPDNSTTVNPPPSQANNSEANSSATNEGSSATSTSEEATPEESNVGNQQPEANGIENPTPDGQETTPSPASSEDPTTTPVVQPSIGVLNGELSGTGPLTNLSLDSVTLTGQLELSQLPFLEQPLFTAFRWARSQLQIDEFRLPNLMADGLVDLAFVPDALPTIGRFDINLRVRELDLAEWEFPFSQRFAISGLTDFDGRIFGSLERPNVDGLLQFDQLMVNQVGFEPLVGPVRFSQTEGILVDLQGERDRIAARLDSQLRPEELVLTYGTTPQTTTRVIAATVPEHGRDRLKVEIQQFPLSVLNLNPAAQFQLGRISGILNSNLMVDISAWDWQQPNPLDNIALMGTVAIAQPSIGYLSADCFQGQIQLADGIANIRDGQMRLRHHVISHPPPPQSVLSSPCADEATAGQSRYTINGRLAATASPSFKGEIKIEQGQIQDWLQTLQFFELQDIARGLKPAQLNTAADVDLVPLPFAIVDDQSSPSNTDLLLQLQRFAEIVALREQQRRQQQREFTLPELQDLNGTFSGVINVTAALNAGLSADFSLRGTDWTWGPYTQPNELIAEGEFADGTLTFLPLRFEAGNSLLNFAGSVGWNENATGQFQATNLSVAWLRQFFKLPLNIDGNLNATAAIRGNLDNPQARGLVTLTDASLNRTPIESAQATFNYADARLGVIGDMQLQSETATTSIDNAGEDSPETADSPPKLISLVGSLPYRLPLAKVEPERDEINLNIALRDDGIALLNLLNEHFFWEDGQGTVTLDVGGTLRQTPDGIDFRPSITGTAQVESATFSAQVLPAPLTNVTGDMQFDGDRITVNTFQGEFSDGSFTAAGVIPLLTPFTTEEIAEFASLSIDTTTASTDQELEQIETTPLPPSQRLLTLDLQNLAVNFKGLYTGGVDGRINVRGTALRPLLGGGITLSRGRASLPDPTLVPPTATVSVDKPSFWTGLISPPELTDLKVTLGEQLLITRLPILNFVATGELVVNGPLQADIQGIIPQGVITLESGQVNVFTTQFNLDRSHNNTAIFTSRTGTDPFLDIRLETSVLEETRRSITGRSGLSNSEIAVTSASDLSQFQTIRIEAEVNGLASQLFNNIQLSSSPSRSEAEIVALIGGGFVDTLGRSEGLIGIANLAGTALFTSLQTLVSNAIGFSDLRIFPTVVTDAEQEESGGDIQSTSTLALAAELGFKLTRSLSISALQLLTVEEPTQYNVRYRINDELLLRGSTNFSDDSRIILEFETRF